MKKRGMKALVAVGVAAAAAALVASPALAEGQWSSSITKAITGFQSRTWQDNNNDNVSTTVTFGTCSTTPGTFSSTSLEMWGEFGLFPDQNLGTKTNYCGTSNWGDVANNAYHFRINKINGSTSGYWVWVGSVVTKY